MFVPGQPEQTKHLQPLAGPLMAEGPGLMENRYLPILHKTIPLRDLCVSAVNLILKGPMRSNQLPCNSTHFGEQWKETLNDGN